MNLLRDRPPFAAVICQIEARRRLKPGTRKTALMEVSGRSPRWMRRERRRPKGEQAQRRNGELITCFDRRLARKAD